MVRIEIAYNPANGETEINVNGPPGKNPFDDPETERQLHELARQMLHTLGRFYTPEAPASQKMVN